MTRLRLFSIAALAVFTAGLAVALLGSGGETGLEAERASAATKKKLITGTLSKPGYTVIALAANGEAVTDIAGPDGSFGLTPPAKTSTLHLRAPDGTYAGPITLTESKAAIAERQSEVKQAKRQVKKAKKKVKKAKKQVKKAKKQVKKAKRSGSKKAQKKANKRLKKANKKLNRAKKRVKKQTRKVRVAQGLLGEAQERRAGSLAIVGTKAGAKLGNVSVISAAGYAKAAASTVEQWDAWADTAGWAQAKAGVPIGAGNFGQVRSDQLDGGPVGDLDRDGVASQLDVDANGNKVLDDTERPSSSARASAVGGSFPSGSKIGAATALNEFGEAANANGGSTDERIADAQAHWGTLGVGWIGIDPGSGELDCGGLTYCLRGGTGRWQNPENTELGSHQPHNNPPFPECCDFDDDGFGSLIDVKGESDSQSSFCGRGCGTGLFHGATVDEIGTGDVLVLRSTVNGVEVQSATTIGFAFSTPPVYAGYDDGQGNSKSFSYATEPPGDEPSPVRAGPDGDVIVDLSVWRPQRSRLESDPGQGKWTDMGNLTYLVWLGLPRDRGSEPDSFPELGPLRSQVGCPQGSLSESDPSLAPPTPAAPLFPEGDYYGGWGGFRDSSSDQPQDPANTLTFTLNLSQCVTSRGFDLEPGDDTTVWIHAWAAGVESGVATAQSSVRIKVQP